MLNQIINYNLYAYPLNPEIVISHGGVCDFHYGQISDSFLLNNYEITYVEIAEVQSGKNNSRQQYGNSPRLC